jgi:hypothetical protein
MLPGATAQTRNLRDAAIQSRSVPDKARTLNSWKEIASYMARGVRTVQRWHHTLQLPVYRINSTNKSPVFAYQQELDQWMQQRAKQSFSGNQSFPAAQERQTEPLAALKTKRWLREVSRSKLLAAQLEQKRFKLMSIDLDTALTLATIAAGASHPRRRKRNESNARRALDAVLKLLNKSNLPDTERAIIEEKLAKVRSALKQIPSRATK